jgi:hypothetical protein
MAEMPCCPHEKPMMPDCQKACPLATFCLAKIFQSVLATDALAILFGVSQAVIPADNANLDTLAPAPAPRPPQA